MSNWHTDQLKYAFGLGGLMSFYGIVFFITYYMPSSTASYNTKIVIVALILLTLPFALVMMFVASRRRKKKEKAEAEAAEAQASESTPEAAKPQKAAVPAASYTELSGGIEETVQFLKTSSLGEGGKDAIYSLPWYIVAGAPRSGKSSLVLGSNLNFQTLASQRQSEQRFIRPTGNVDWRVTSEAVFVDTAGRYQTEGVDAEEWNSLLESLKKYRSARPLDGFLLAIDTAKLLKSDDREIEEMAKILRSRLDDAIQRLKVRFPVYLVFTNADSIEGFRDSFSTSKNEGKSLVWGATIPLEKAENAQSMFDGEYAILHNSLMKRRVLRLSAPFPPVRQLRIFNFPLHFGSARRKLGTFASALFRPNPFSENPFLRGFYFVADPAAKAVEGIPPTVGQTYFSERFFRDVLLRDKDLVRTNQAQRQRGPILGWLMTISGVFLVTFLLVMAGVSLYNNKQMLDQAKNRGEKLLTYTKTDSYKNPPKAENKAILEEINTTENLRALLVNLDDYERNSPPWYMRFGLYSGDRVYKQHLLPIYMTVIEHRYKTPVIDRVEADLKKFASSNPVANASNLTEAEEQNLTKYYDLLSVYLMLTDKYKTKADPTTIANVLKDYWVSDSKIPPDLKLVAGQQLDFWAKQVDREDADYKFPRIVADAKIVEDARKKLQAFPLVYRYYRRIVTETSKTVEETQGKMTLEGILTRNGADTTSLMEGTYTVPGAFTRAGLDSMRLAIIQADVKLSEPDWVMGDETGKNVTQTTSEIGRLQDRYYRDYADSWKKLVAGVTVKPYKSKDDTLAALTSFSSASSPMKILLIEINKNTFLSAKPETQTWWEWIKSFLPKSAGVQVDSNTQPENEFRPLQTFVGAKDAKDALIDKYRAELNGLSGSLAKTGPDGIKQAAAELQNDKDTLNVRGRENNINGMLGGFNTPPTQELARLIKEPLTNLKVLLGADAVTQIKKAWTDQIQPAAKDVEKGYPFDDTGDADLNKLTAYLNPTNGKLSQFYDTQLKKYFDEVEGKLKVKEGSEVKFTDEFVAYLNNAFALRKALYGTNATPKFDYAFTLKPSKDLLVEIIIDGQSVKSEGTGSLNGTFPAAGSAETGVIINLGSGGSTTTAPPPASNSNSAAKPSSTNSNSASSSTAGTSPRYPGTWGLFKFVDAGHPQKQPGGEYSLSYSVGGKSVSASIKPSGGDLFDKTVFKQLRAPQTLMK